MELDKGSNEDSLGAKSHVLELVLASSNAEPMGRAVEVKPTTINASTSPAPRARDLQVYMLMFVCGRGDVSVCLCLCL